ncbi:MAG: hypothetical protein EA365_03880 [Gloeocapsa sp. DLM2.Bin57]|nr:MAG: hypothetical protein EA365_03880 [Gloeocapsa sp. DLM2.Bin57]
MSLKNTILGITCALACLNPSIAIADNSAQIQQLRQRLEDYELEIQNLQIEMGAYMLTNPKASAAVIASGGGLAGILEQNIDDNTRVILLGLGLIGVNYCLNPDNFQHCNVVATNLTSYGMRLSNYSQQIDRIEREIFLLE